MERRVGAERHSQCGWQQQVWSSGSHGDRWRDGCPAAAAAVIAGRLGSTTGQAPAELADRGWPADIPFIPSAL